VLQRYNWSRDSGLPPAFVPGCIHTRALQEPALAVLQSDQPDTSEPASVQAQHCDQASLLAVPLTLPLCEDACTVLPRGAAWAAVLICDLPPLWTSSPWQRSAFSCHC